MIHKRNKGALLKNLKEENALKLVRPVYRNVDVAGENVFTYSDLIFVFFHEGSSMADIEKALKKNNQITLLWYRE